MFRFLADLLPPADVCVNMLAMPHAPPAVTSPAPHRLPAAGPTTGEEPAAPYVRQRALAREQFRCTRARTDARSGRATEQNDGLS